MLAWCWPTVYDAGPTLNQHWLNVEGWKRKSEIQEHIFIWWPGPVGWCCHMTLMFLWRCNLVTGHHAAVSLSHVILIDDDPITPRYQHHHYCHAPPDRSANKLDEKTVTISRRNVMTSQGVENDVPLALRINSRVMKMLPWWQGSVSYKYIENDPHPTGFSDSIFHSFIAGIVKKSISALRT